MLKHLTNIVNRVLWSDTRRGREVEKHVAPRRNGGFCSPCRQEETVTMVLEPWAANENGETRNNGGYTSNSPADADDDSVGSPQRGHENSETRNNVGYTSNSPVDDVDAAGSPQRCQQEQPAGAAQDLWLGTEESGAELVNIGTENAHARSLVPPEGKDTRHDDGREYSAAQTEINKSDLCRSGGKATSPSHWRSEESVASGLELYTVSQTSTHYKCDIGVSESYALCPAANTNGISNTRSSPCVSPTHWKSEESVASGLELYPTSPTSKGNKCGTGLSLSDGLNTGISSKDTSITDVSECSFPSHWTSDESVASGLEPYPSSKTIDDGYRWEIGLSKTDAIYSRVLGEEVSSGRSESASPSPWTSEESVTSEPKTIPRSYNTAFLESEAQECTSPNRGSMKERSGLKQGLPHKGIESTFCKCDMDRSERHLGYSCSPTKGLSEEHSSLHHPSSETAESTNNDFEMSRIHKDEEIYHLSDIGPWEGQAQVSSTCSDVTGDVSTSEHGPTSVEAAACKNEESGYFSLDRKPGSVGKNSRGNGTCHNLINKTNSGSSECIDYSSSENGDSCSSKNDNSVDQIDSKTPGSYSPSSEKPSKNISISEISGTTPDSVNDKNNINARKYTREEKSMCANSGIDSAVQGCEYFMDTGCPETCLDINEKDISDKSSYAKINSKEVSENTDSENNILIFDIGICAEKAPSNHTGVVDLKTSTENAVSRSKMETFDQLDCGNSEAEKAEEQLVVAKKCAGDTHPVRPLQKYLNNGGNDNGNYNGNTTHETSLNDGCHGPKVCHLEAHNTLAGKTVLSSERHVVFAGERPEEGENNKCTSSDTSNGEIVDRISCKDHQLTSTVPIETNDENAKKNVTCEKHLLERPHGFCNSLTVNAEDDLEEDISLREEDFDENLDDRINLVQSKGTAVASDDEDDKCVLRCQCSDAKGLPLCHGRLVSPGHRDHLQSAAYLDRLGGGHPLKEPAIAYQETDSYDSDLGSSRSEAGVFTPDTPDDSKALPVDYSSPVLIKVHHLKETDNRNFSSATELSSKSDPIKLNTSHSRRNSENYDSDLGSSMSETGFYAPSWKDDQHVGGGCPRHLVEGGRVVCSLAGPISGGVALCSTCGKDEVVTRQDQINRLDCEKNNQFEACEGKIPLCAGFKQSKNVKPACKHLCPHCGIDISSLPNSAPSKVY